MRITCGFSLRHDSKKSLENNRSFELKIEDPLETVEHELITELLLVQVNDETEDVEVVGEGGHGDILFDTGMGVLGILGACEITSLSWTWLNSFMKCFLGLHLLMQQPILSDLN